MAFHNPFQAIRKDEYNSLTKPCLAGPYVTSVGGTEHLMPEVATDLSGGGFSNYHPRLPYQDDAVNGFFDELGAEYAGLYKCALFRVPDFFLLRNLCSRWGRGYPDISAQAYGCRIVFNGVPDVLSGTACAVSVCLSLLLPHSDMGRPFSSTQLTANVQTAAGIFSMLNDFLISQNREPLGFLNPWLYDEGRAGLTDIVEGSNPGCGTDGFSAVAGWDPVRPAWLLSYSTLILCPIGNGSWDAKLSTTAGSHSP